MLACAGVSLRPTDVSMVKYVVYPIVCVCSTLAVLTYCLRDNMPQDLSKESWQTFTVFLLGGAGRISTQKAVVLLLGVQFLQIIVCVPFLHITQILIGYHMGMLGLPLSAAWEMFLVTIYVLMCRSPLTPKSTLLLAYIDHQRTRGRLYFSILCTFMSSIPLNSSMCMLVFGDVTLRDFLGLHAVVTLTMAMKNVYIGEVVRRGAKGPVLYLCMLFMVVFSIVPTLFTLYLTMSVYYSVPCAESSHTDVDEIEGGDGEILIALLVSLPAEGMTECPQCQHCTDDATPDFQLSTPQGVHVPLAHPPHTHPPHTHSPHTLSPHTHSPRTHPTHTHSTHTHPTHTRHTHTRHTHTRHTHT